MLPIMIDWGPGMWLRPHNPLEVTVDLTLVAEILILTLIKSHSYQDLTYRPIILV